jgi:hypothetical protein
LNHSHLKPWEGGNITFKRKFNSHREKCGRHFCF